ncbi:unnamed protein product [Discula destructiva]
MDISDDDQDEKTRSLSPPEILALSPDDDDDDDDDSVSFLDTNAGKDPYTDHDRCIHIEVDIMEEDSQDIGPWLFIVTAAAVHGDDSIASVTAYLIKREEIQARDDEKTSFRKALRDEKNMMDVMCHSPKIFNSSGHATPEFLMSLSLYFQDEDMQRYLDTQDVAEQPLNRAWILLIRDIEVEPQYRRLGIGGNMVREMIQAVLAKSDEADRPLLVAVQPKSFDEFPYEEMIQMNNIVYKRRIIEVFWESIGFKRYPRVDSGFLGPWQFWGTPLALPPKKRLSIPDDLAMRNTRTATPPPRSPFPRRVYADRKVNDETRSRSPAAHARVQRHVRNDDAASRNDDAASGRWLDDPTDPAVSPASARLIINLMKMMDVRGKPYRIRPFKRLVQQVPLSPEPDQQPKNPFKAPAGRPVAPVPTLKRESALESKSALQSMQAQLEPNEPSPRFLVR